MAKAKRRRMTGAGLQAAFAPERGWMEACPKLYLEMRSTLRDFGVTNHGECAIKRSKGLYISWVTCESFQLILIDLDNRPNRANFRTPDIGPALSVENRAAANKPKGTAAQRIQGIETPGSSASATLYPRGNSGCRRARDQVHPHRPARLRARKSHFLLGLMIARDWA